MNKMKALYSIDTREMSAKEKVRIGCQMYLVVRERVEMNVRKRFGHLPEKEIGILIARRMYRNDKMTQKLLDSVCKSLNLKPGHPAL